MAFAVGVLPSGLAAAMAFSTAAAPPLVPTSTPLLTEQLSEAPRVENSLSPQLIPDVVVMVVFTAEVSAGQRSAQLLVFAHILMLMSCLQVLVQQQSSGSASGWPCEMSCCCRVKTAVRVQPGTVQVISLSSRVSSRDWHASQRCFGAGLSVAKASSWAVALQVQGLVHPGRSHLRSMSCKRRDFSRHGSHMPSVDASPSDGPCPSPNALLDSWSQVRVHPGTRQGMDLAPNRSASVNFPAAIRSFVWWQQPFDKASGNSASGR